MLPTMAGNGDTLSKAYAMKQNTIPEFRHRKRAINDAMMQEAEADWQGIQFAEDRAHHLEMAERRAKEINDANKRARLENVGVPTPVPRDMSWASSTALPFHGLRHGERFVDYTKPPSPPPEDTRAEEQHPPSPPPEDTWALWHCKICQDTNPFLTKIYETCGEPSPQQRKELIEENRKRLGPPLQVYAKHSYRERSCINALNLELGQVLTEEIELYALGVMDTVNPQSGVWRPLNHISALFHNLPVLSGSTRIALASSGGLSQLLTSTFDINFTPQHPVE
jgi:hypothetical protein